MTPPAELLSLAARVEALSGCDLEVDALVWLECVPGATRREFRYAHKASGKECVIDETRENGRLIIVPAYTASIDAAVTLVPVTWKLRQMHFNAPCADDRKWHLNLHGGPVGEDIFVGRGATPALALAAAAIRALAAKEDGRRAR